MNIHIFELIDDTVLAGGADGYFSKQDHALILWVISGMLLQQSNTWSHVDLLTNLLLCLYIHKDN